MSANLKPETQSQQPKYFYKEFGSDKVRFTRGRFQGWTEPTGLLNVRYAIFQNRRGTVFVPIYQLTKETRAILESVNKSEQAK